MAIRNADQIFRSLSNFKAKYQNIAINAYTNRKYVVDSRRYYASKSAKKIEPCDDGCPNKTCKKEKKRSFWGLFASKKVEVCKDDQNALMVTKLEKKPHLNWGPAYLMEKDLVSVETAYKEAPLEDNKNPEDSDENPMPDFTTVEQRLIDLTERKLHPYYRVYQSIPKKLTLGLPERPFYKSRSGPVSLDEVPERLQIKRELLGRDIEFDDIKKVELPQQVLAKMAEIRKNERPTLGPHGMTVPVPRNTAEVAKEKTVFDTLYQNKTKF